MKKEHKFSLYNNWGEMSILTVIDDLPDVFPCFSKALDSFLCDTIYERK